eukprot:10968459-Alexandrium_andersonii.AAC.1
MLAVLRAVVFALGVVARCLLDRGRPLVQVVLDPDIRHLLEQIEQVVGLNRPLDLVIRRLLDLVPCRRMLDLVPCRLLLDL